MSIRIEVGEDGYTKWYLVYNESGALIIRTTNVSVALEEAERA